MAACMCNIESVETQAHEDAQKTKLKVSKSNLGNIYLAYKIFKTQFFSYNYLLPIHMKRIKMKTNKTTTTTTKNEIKSKISLSTASKQEL